MTYIDCDICVYFCSISEPRNTVYSNLQSKDIYEPSITFIFMIRVSTFQIGRNDS